MGDEDLLATLARERGRALFGYAYLLSGDRHAAEDLVQEALVRTFSRRRAGFTPDDAEAYVRRAILTVFLDGARRRARWARVRHLVGASDEPARDPGPVVGATLDVRAALATLAPQERAAAVLRWCEDLTVPEVAARMGLADGTVKRYLSTAGHKLEALLGPLPDGTDETAPLTGGRTRP
ncbi:sigma-70 family RNA polymerase sigma factor [Cellulomonas composti]|uniref:DNA-directed RNA polymerase sigma-70 factor n=1 Tax=Cellulomonas composti TaxID=266130 RepID=A0A511JCU6_9CELL|nr:sigma-70 family RNA polymerase sigma factor [Cellulomonas composti]GEL95805.1 DNA-directed RNA polymerase sigma-70 factor [Cellulomonas composti]